MPSNKFTINSNVEQEEKAMLECQAAIDVIADFVARLHDHQLWAARGIINDAIDNRVAKSAPCPPQA